MAKMGFFEKIFVNSRLDHWYHKYLGFYRFLSQIDLRESVGILEIGCGVGITSNFIASKFTKSKLTATDFDAQQVEHAKRSVVKDNIEFKQEDATKLSFSDASFDICFAIFVFHHIENYPQAVKELHRVA